VTSQLMRVKTAQVPGASALARVPISLGELADKITILEIKLERIADQMKRDNVRLELELLREAWTNTKKVDVTLELLMKELKKVNETLWTIEDDIRDCERRKDFGSRFVELARSVYKTNDRRSEIKREINLLLGSGIIEEKSYESY
jgi:chaperonin cofactor prefoldin